MKSILFGLLSILSFSASSQSERNAFPTDFDFWLGEWDLYWNDSLKGSNVITKEHNGNVIHENFVDFTTGFKGESWSVCDKNLKKWRQTWVDNNGAYIDLKGGITKVGMVLFSEKFDGKKTIHYRMRFLNITKDSLDWEWSESGDEMKSWTVKWAIQYKRKQPLPIEKYVQQELSKGKQYYIALFKKGPKHATMDSVTTKQVIAKHLSHLFSLHRDGKLNIMGPIMDDSDIAGISIYNVASREEVVQLIESDEAFKSGRITYELYSWFSILGYKLE